MGPAWLRKVAMEIALKPSKVTCLPSLPQVNLAVWQLPLCPPPPGGGPVSRMRVWVSWHRATTMLPLYILLLRLQQIVKMLSVMLRINLSCHRELKKRHRWMAMIVSLYPVNAFCSSISAFSVVRFGGRSRAWTSGCWAALVSRSSTLGGNQPDEYIKARKA